MGKLTIFAFVFGRYLTRNSLIDTWQKSTQRRISLWRQSSQKLDNHRVIGRVRSYWISLGLERHLEDK